MRLRQHLELIQNIINSRQEIVIDSFQVQEIVPGREGVIQARLRFWDGSLLEFVEVLIEHGFVLIKTDYAYHYQDANGQIVFRYDNAPHHPEVTTHPHHKHTPNAIESATPPHLADVLQEIDKWLYPEAL